MATKETTHNHKKAEASHQAVKVPSPQLQTEAPAILNQQIHPAALIQRGQVDPAALTPPDVLSLQRAVGNRAVSQILQPRPRPATRVRPAGRLRAAVLQRAKITPQQVVDAVKDIEFGGTDVGQIKLGDATKKTEQDITRQEYAARMMTELQQKWENVEAAQADQARNDNYFNAMLLVHALDVIADYIARSNVVFFPRLKPQIAEAFFKYFQAELSQSLETTGLERPAIAQALELAQHISAQDPITLYMKALVKKEAAAGQIQSMAAKAHIPAGDMFELLRRKFLDEINVLTPEELEKGEQKLKAIEAESRAEGSTFPLKELAGEISVLFAQYVKGEKPNYQVAEGATIMEGAAERLDELKQAVLAIGHHQAGAAAPAQTLGAYIARILNVPLQDAEPLERAVIAKLQQAPVTITIPHNLWFDKAGLKTRPIYQHILARQSAQEKMSSLIKPGIPAAEKMTTLGRKGRGPSAELMQQRGPGYMRWRADKDTRAEGEDVRWLDFPIFGALCYWDLEKWGGGAETKDEVLQIGRNYYGDVHLVLRASVKERVKYKWTDQGKKHNSIRALLGELVSKGDQQGHLAVVIGAVLGSNLQTVPDPKIEAAVIGGINVDTDVQKVVTAPGVPAGIQQGIAKWAQRHGIDYLSGLDVKFPAAEMNRRLAEEGGAGVAPVAGYQAYKLGEWYQQMGSPSITGLLQKRDLFYLITTVLNERAWAHMGKGFLPGSTKVPDGVAHLREIVRGAEENWNETLAQIEQAAQARLHEASRSRQGLTARLYQILAQCNTAPVATTRTDLEHLSAELNG